MSKIPEHWIQKAESDIAAAKTLLAGGQFLYVLFCCQQAIEKMTKALIAKNTGQLPPRIHNLMLLSERAGLNLDDERETLFADLSNYYIQSRYPEEWALEEKSVTAEEANAVYQKTEETVKWLLSRI